MTEGGTTDAHFNPSQTKLKPVVVLIIASPTRLPVGGWAVTTLKAGSGIPPADCGSTASKCPIRVSEFSAKTQSL